MTTLATLMSFHPGHGSTDPVSFRHYFTEPMHAGVIALAALAIVAAYAVMRRATRAS